MDSLSIFSLNGFFELKMYYKHKCFFISLTNIETNEDLFYERCDTFIKGDLILHLKKAIKKFKNNKNKIILSRWYRNVSNRFGLGNEQFPYITTIIDNINNIDVVIFKVFINSNENYIFETKLSELEELIGTNKNIHKNK